MFKKSFLLSVFSVFLVSFAGAAPSSAPKMIGEYDDWVAYYHKDAGGIVCYMASTPKKDEGKYTKRGDIYAVVTHRPSEKSFDVINFSAGYTYKPDTAVTVKIGSQTFNKLFTSGDKAWAVSERVDQELVAAMKRGSRMIVNGTSAKGTATKDTYSLAGFGSAYKAISAKCGKK